jgi:hypothetical protein
MREPTINALHAVNAIKSKEWADAKSERDKALKTVRRYAVEQRN